MVSAIDPNTSYQVINCGQHGFALSQILRVEREMLQAEPDFFILYLGNNEFFYHRADPFTDDWPAWFNVLKYYASDLRLVRLLSRNQEEMVRRETEYQSGYLEMLSHANYYSTRRSHNQWDRDHCGEVLAEFREQLELLLASAREHGIKVALCTVAVNLRDFEPYGSYHRKDLSSGELARWNRLLEQGEQAFMAGDYSAARGLFQQARALDDQSADLDFRLGWTMLRLGDTAGARQFFQAAVDFDRVRDRAGSEINRIIRDAAKHHPEVILVDVESRFAAAAPDGLPGRELFLDQVHPDLSGHRLIARAVEEAMVQAGWVSSPPGWRERADRAKDDHRNSMPIDYLFSSYFTAASWDVFTGRFFLGNQYVDRALQFKPHEPGAVEQKQNIELVLRRLPPYSTRPWGEVEMALKYRPNEAWRLKP